MQTRLALTLQPRLASLRLSTGASATGPTAAPHYSYVCLLLNYRGHRNDAPGFVPPLELSPVSIPLDLRPET